MAAIDKLRAGQRIADLAWQANTAALDLTLGAAADYLESIKEEGRERFMLAHPWVGDGEYCQFWQTGSCGNPSTGVITMSAQCGYPRDCHPDTGSDITATGEGRA